MRLARSFGKNAFNDLARMDDRVHDLSRNIAISMEKKMVTGAKRINFPTPGATKEKELVTMIDAERMLAHFNQDHPNLPKPAQRVTQKIIDHTSAIAIEAGWVGTAVAKDAISGHTSGLMLLRAKKTTISVDVVDEQVISAQSLAGPSD